MEMNFITFRSVTPAQRGQRILQQAGIACSLQRTPRWMEERGCGYCLRLRQAETQRAVALLRQANQPFSKVYSTKDGAGEALPL